MKIDRVEVSYKELRTDSDYSNRSYGLTLGANLELGEKASQVKKKLLEIAKADVCKFFEGDAMDIPF